MAYFDSNRTMGYNNTSPVLSDAQRHLCPPFSRAIYATMNSSVPYHINGAINALLATPTTFANLLVLLAMRHVTSIRRPSKLLLCNLALTDVGTGLVTHPIYSFALLVSHDSDRLTCTLERILYVAGSLFGGVSTITLTAISLDRYYALFWRLRYQQMFTTARAGVIVFFSWALPLCFALTWLWDAAIATGMLIGGSLLTFAVISVAYIKIFRGLRNQHALQVHALPPLPGQPQGQATNSFNVVKYKKLASVTCCVYSLFLINHTPLLFCYLTIVVYEHNTYVELIREYAYTILLLNSCLNPFVYCMRLPEIRAGILKQLRNISLNLLPRETASNVEGRIGTGATMMFKRTQTK